MRRLVRDVLDLVRHDLGQAEWMAGALVVLFALVVELVCGLWLVGR